MVFKSSNSLNLNFIYGKNWQYIWTRNSNVFVKKDDNASITAIKNELDLNLIKR